MKILHVTPCYYPATYYGGPIVTTYALCNALAELPDVELRVLTSDMAGPRLADRVPVTGVRTHYPGGYDVYFARRRVKPNIAPGLLAKLWGMIGWADGVLLTGTYSFPTIPTLAVCRLRGKPLVWSPHGALLASHLWKDSRRPVLKRAWETMCLSVRPRCCLLHVTSEVERAASCARLRGIEGIVLANAVDIPPELPPRRWTPNGVLRLMFIGRISPEKGVDKLLHALAALDWATSLDLYGTGGPDYMGEMMHLVEALGLAARVRFHGHVDGEAKRDAFLGADLVVLSSHPTENFGMVVAEALAHGVPVVVSRGAPWPDLESRGCGLWVSNDPQSLAQAIEALRGADLEAMGRRGRVWMKADFGWDQRARAMKAVLEDLVQASRIHVIEASRSRH
jgi:glycosyltransferase involved in cell wall biosynthesis